MKLGKQDRHVPSVPAVIGADLKVADVLTAWPAALDVLLDMGFAPLRNPIARRTVAKLIVADVIRAGCNLCGEPFDATTQLAALSGGQSRALMIADAGLLSRSPIILVDEIENAGIDREQAIHWRRRSTPSPRCARRSAPAAGSSRPRTARRARTSSC